MKKCIFIVLGITIAITSACKSGHREFVNNGDDTAAESTADSTAANEAKLIKTSEIKFKVKNVQQSSEQLNALTNHYGGVVMHYESHTDADRSQDIRLSPDSLLHITSQSINAQMTVKIPSENLERFMDEAGKMGLYVNLRELNIEDKTFHYLSAKLKLQSRVQLVHQQKSGKIIIKDPAAVMQLKDEMVDQKINNMLVDNEVKYSTAILSFYQSNVITKEVIADDNPDTFQLPFFRQLELALVKGWYLFEEFVIGVANLWALILITLLIWYAVRTYRRYRLKTLALNS